MNLKQATLEYARGNHTPNVLSVVFSNRVKNFDKIYKESDPRRYGEFIECLAKDQVFRFNKGTLLDKHLQPVTKIEGTGGADRVDVRYINYDEKTITYESGKMKKGGKSGGIGFGTSEIEGVALALIKDQNAYYPDYEMRTALWSFGGLTSRGQKEAAEHFNPSTGIKFESYDLDVIRRAFYTLAVFYQKHNFDPKTEYDEIVARFHQQHLLDQYGKETLYEDFSILINHACRTGKTYTALLLILKYAELSGNWNFNVAIVTGMPTLFIDWMMSAQKVFNNKAAIHHMNRNGFTYVDEKINIVLSSSQMLLESTDIDEDGNKIKFTKHIVDECLYSQEFAFVVFDECHRDFLADTTKSNIDKLITKEQTGLIGLSATPFRENLHKHFKFVDNFTYFDKERAKRNPNVIIRKDYENDPSKKTVWIKPSDRQLVELKSSGGWDDETGPNLGAIANQTRMIDHLLSIIDNSVYGGFCIEEEDNILHDGLWVVGSISEARKVYKRATNNPQLQDCNFKVFNSKDTPNVAGESKQFFMRKDKTRNIAIVVDQLTTGHTMPTVDHVLLLSESASLIKYLQTGERGGTRHEFLDGWKDKYFVIDFSQHRILEMAYHVKRQLLSSGDGYTETEINELMPIWVHNGVETLVLSDENIQSETQDWLLAQTKGKTYISAAEIWAGIDIIDNDLNLGDEDLNDNSSKLTVEQQRSGKKGKPKSMTRVKPNEHNDNADQGENEDCERNQNVDFLQYVLNAFPTLTYLDNTLDNSDKG